LKSCKVSRPAENIAVHRGSVKPTPFLKGGKKMIYHNIALFILLWLVCGFWAAGISYGFFYGRYAKVLGDTDRGWCYSWGMSGGIVALLICLIGERKRGYGNRW
jgi:hypothetical protein